MVDGASSSTVGRVTSQSPPMAAARRPDRGLLLSLEQGGPPTDAAAPAAPPLTPSSSPVRGPSPSASPGRYAKLGGGGGRGGGDDAGDDDAAPPPPPAVDHRKLGALAVAVISFGSVAGGPYGIEAAVGAAGALPTLVGCAALAFLWSAPQALVTAELATAFPSNGGYITWGVRGLGPVLGFVNAANCVASAVCNLPLYPVLFVSYIATLDPSLSPWALFAIKAAALALVVGLNLVGIKAVEAASLLFTVIVQTPFILMPLVAQAAGAPAFAWGAGPSSVLPSWRANFAVFVSTLCWNAQGWVNVGNLASDVRNPRVAYPAGSALAVGLVSLNYIYPVWVCSALAPDAAAWDTGYFATVGSAVAPWLGAYTTAASLFSCANNFLPQLGTTSRALRFAALYRMLPLPGLAANWRWGGGGCGCGCGRGRGRASGEPAPAPATSVPGVAILLQGALCGVLMNFSFDVLVIVNVLFYNVGLMLQFGAFLALKHNHPALSRPFQVPGGLPGAWATTAAFAGVLCCAFYAAAVSSPWAMLILLVANLVFVLGGLAWARWGYHEGLLDEVDAAEAAADAAGAGAGAAAGVAACLEPDVAPAATAGDAGVSAPASPHEVGAVLRAVAPVRGVGPLLHGGPTASWGVDAVVPTSGSATSSGGGGSSASGGGAGAVAARAGGGIGVEEEAARSLLSADYLHAGSSSNSSRGSSSSTSSNSNSSASSASTSACSSSAGEEGSGCGDEVAGLGSSGCGDDDGGGRHSSRRRCSAPTPGGTTSDVEGWGDTDTRSLTRPVGSSGGWPHGGKEGPRWGRSRRGSAGDCPSGAGAGFDGAAAEPHALRMMQPAPSCG